MYSNILIENFHILNKISNYSSLPKKYTRINKFYINSFSNLSLSSIMKEIDADLKNLYLITSKMAGNRDGS